MAVHASPPPVRFYWNRRQYRVRRVFKGVLNGWNTDDCSNNVIYEGVTVAPLSPNKSVSLTLMLRVLIGLNGLGMAIDQITTTERANQRFKMARTEYSHM
jgi:hypothetical protein